MLDFTGLKPGCHLCLVCLLWLVGFLQPAVAQTPEQFRSLAEQRLLADLERLQALPENADTLAERAHTRFFLGSVNRDDDAALSQLQFGRSRAEQALDLQPGHREARVWYVVNTLRIFGQTRPFSALWKMDDLEAELKSLRDEAPDFLFAVADRVLAVMYGEAPEFLLGSDERAEFHFRQALERAPDFPANTLLFADFLLTRERQDEARELLRAWSGEAALDRFPLYEMIWRRDLALLRQRLGD